MNRARATVTSHSGRLLATFMVGAGVMHFVAPSAYDRIVPRKLGHARGLVQLSGVAEILAGALLWSRRTRRLGAWLTVAVLVAVFPANVQMALDGGVRDAGFPANSALLAWLRLPLQWPLIRWAQRHTVPEHPPEAPGVGPGRLSG